MSNYIVNITLIKDKSFIYNIVLTEIYPYYRCFLRCVDPPSGTVCIQLEKLLI